jgi:hypothetical protein
MTVRIVSDGVIALEGDCPLEDAEVLQRSLLAHPAAAIDWGSCSHAHTAVIQILLAAQPRLTGTPDSPFLRSKVAAQIRAHTQRLTD